MAHNLNFNNGVASFASRKEPAWHGLGKIVEAMTSEEAIKLGGLDFIVEKRPLYVPGVDMNFEEAKQYKRITRSFIRNEEQTLVPVYNKLVKFKEQFATVRTDNDFPLGIVGSKYHVIQNHEAFNFIDSIVGQKYAEYETVGALGNGETIFITCKLKQEMIINKDLIDKYLLLTMAHDGTGSIQVMFTPIRVVCNNTLTIALRGNKNKVVIKHTAKAMDRLEQAKQILGLVDQKTQAYEEAFKHLLKIQISDEKAELIIEKSLGLVRDEKDKFSTRAENIFTLAKKYYQVGLGQQEIVGTGYGVFNAITGYLQNVKNYSDADAKFKATFLNTQNIIRDTAYNLILNED
jgi:phage/plasmid-like protein (TIGR03299 family)